MPISVTAIRQPTALPISVQSAPSTQVVPTSTTMAPGFTASRPWRPGAPAAATRMSARATSAARSRVRLWATVTMGGYLFVGTEVTPSPTILLPSPHSDRNRDARADRRSDGHGHGGSTV